MGHVFDPQNRHRLKNEKRKKILPPEETVAKLPLNPGEVILDYGAGIGYFTVPLAKRTGSSGVVYAVDISPEIIKDLEEEVLKEGLTNVKTALVPGDGSLPEEFPEFDVIFLATVLHELSEKEAVLSALTQKLKKQGKLIIIDWEKKETEFGPPVAHRVSVEEAVSYLEKAGLKLLQKMNVSAAHWGIIGIKE
ncbi:conserved hypothetical protein [Carboxydothermus hydrogenoformans Z-2901]|uniref:Methyltransferase domain-containing protein n=2 Tax=Carboxydothermus hydrogenoformans TaxID=129958 RepID=Q3AEM4_CARHZ|nr:conserved hypothetical protein [Carboxydothermus hydrogenoformans Z-2901]